MKIFSNETDKAIGLAATRVATLADLLIAVIAKVDALVPGQPVTRK